jgi:hypothetical protein
VQKRLLCKSRRACSILNRAWRTQIHPHARCKRECESEREKSKRVACATNKPALYIFILFAVSYFLLPVMGVKRLPTHSLPARIVAAVLPWLPAAAAEQQLDLWDSSFITRCCLEIKCKQIQSQTTCGETRSALFFSLYYSCYQYFPTQHGIAGSAAN